MRDDQLRVAHVKAHETVLSLYDELHTIDDALDLAGAPKANARVGRIRLWAEREKQAVGMRGSEPQPDKGKGILTDEELSRSYTNKRLTSFELGRVVEAAVLRKVAAISRDYRGDNYQNPIVALSRELLRLAGDPQ